MLKSLIFGLAFIGLVFGGGPVRVKLTVNKGHRVRSYGPPVNETLKDHGDYYYTGEIHVGTPPKKFVVDFDTGSPVTWLADKKCHYDDGGDCTSQDNRYSLEDSSSSTDLHERFHIQYGTGSADGEYISDKVGLTPDTSVETTKPTFHMGTVDNLAKFFKNLKADGLFGLSFDEGKGHPPFIDYLKDNNVFDTPIFTVWLDHDLKGKPIGGEIIFGGKDDAHCGADIVTVPGHVVESECWWTFEVDGFYLDGEKIADKANAISDSGSTLMTVPTRVYNKLAEKYPLGQAIDCDEHQDIKIELEVKGHKLVLDAVNLIIPTNYPGKCEIGIMGRDDPEYGYLLGDTFIKSYCQIHNYKDATLTFAQAKHPKLNQ